MGKREYSAYQRGVIERYYENLDGLSLAKLQELVGELYLAKDTRAEDRLWEQVDKALVRLKVKAGLREHIMRGRRAEILAGNLEDWLRAAGQRKK